MSIFDKRLIPADAAPGAGPPNLADNTFQVDGTNNLTDAFVWVKNFALGQPGQKIDVFNILCHGLYAWAESDELKQSALVGGFGLQLCKQNLTVATMDSIAPLVRGRLNEVYIYACGASSKQASGAVNGVSFCKQMARKFDCVVYAANRMQVYSYSRTSPMALNFGEWEGSVTRFTKDDDGVLVGSFASPNRT